MAVTGSLQGNVYLNTLRPLNVTLGANEYPNGTISFNDIAPGQAYWFNDYSTRACTITVYLCDSSGENLVPIFDVTAPARGSNTTTKTATISGAQGLAGKTLYVVAGGEVGAIIFRGVTSVTINTASLANSITCQSSGNGSLTASAASAGPGETIALYPSPNTGYELSSYTTSPSLSISNNRFTMPGQAVTITANFSKKSYSITKKVSPSGSGTLTGSSSATMGTTVTLTPTPATGYQLSSYTTSPSLTISNNKFTMPAQNVTVTANFTKISYSITKSVSPSGGGTLTCASSAKMGDTVTLSVAPATGYKFSGYTTSPSLTITDNKFTMPAQAVTITASFTKISYSITKKVSPSGAGTVTCASSATMGTSVSISQSANSGYVFDKWTSSPSLTISGGAFTMPASAVTVTANYVKLSTGTLSSTTVKGGSTATLTITTESSSYTHKYRLYYNSSTYTSQVSVAAGTTRVTVSIPDSWANNIPSATTKSGCYLRIWTYKNGTSYGYTDITGITYQVPDDAKPSIGTITKSIARTISGTTYADIGNYYTQNKCGVRVQATATANYSATIASIKVALSGYSGTKYVKTFTYSAASASVDFTTGLLTISGKTTITVTATDTRGRTKSSTTTITVTAYSKPSGSLAVWRTDASDNTDPMGTYGRFSLTKKYTAVGSNSLTVTLTARGTTETVTGTSGRLLPNSRKTFDIETQYTIKLTLTDAFGSTVINMTLPSAMFIIYVNANGDKISFMKAATKSIPSGKDATIEFSGNAQIYIGDSTLEDYIRNIVNNM